MTETDTLIVGAGLTGLSAAYHAGRAQKDYILIERQDRVGGLCKSVFKDGFYFDYSGHVIHTREKYTRALLESLLGKNTVLAARNAWVFLKKTYVPYPFQANLFYLPERIIKECVEGVLSARKTKSAPQNFEQWALSAYGPGICKYFLLPYNQKLWTVPPRELTPDWAETFIPKLSTRDIVKGAYAESNESYGYNTFFLYPKTGGIGALAEAFAAKIKNLRLNTALLRVDIENKMAYTTSGEIKFKKLITTMPLDKFLSAAKIFEEERKQLRHNTVHVLNIGINRKIENISWVYFPEEKFTFYRAGVQSAFSPQCAPAGASSIYVEIATPANQKLLKRETETKILQQLKEGGILEDGDKILTKLWLEIPAAYCIFDAHRKAAVPKIISALNKQGIYPAGRYGAWEYSFMEKNILDGKRLAETL